MQHTTMTDPAAQTVDQHIKERLDYIVKRSHFYLGYPEHVHGYFRAQYPEMLTQFICNCGSPFTEGENYEVEAKDFERDVLHYFMDMYGLDRASTYGYIGNGTTEGNLYALFRGREELENPTLVFSDNAHYSLEKIAKILRMPYHIIPGDETGAMRLDALADTLATIDPTTPILVAATVGTTFTGAIDNVEKIHEILTRSGHTFLIHVDAALFGGYLPYIENAFCRSFMTYAHSIAFSLQKFFGVPLAAGLVMVRETGKKSSISQSIEYFVTEDSTSQGRATASCP